MSERDVVLAKKNREAGFELTQYTFRAVLVAVDYTDKADVLRQPGYVWFQEREQRTDASPGIAFNRKVPSIPGLAVVIKQNPKPPYTYEVFDWDKENVIDLPDYTGTPLLPQHARDHEPGGYDPLNVYTRMLVALKTYAAGGLKVSIAGYGDFPGYNNYDLTSSKPAAGLARYVLISLKPDSTLRVTDGSTAADIDSVPPPKPDLLDGDIASAYVRLDGSQTTIVEADIVDARDFLNRKGIDILQVQVFS